MMRIALLLLLIAGTAACGRLGNVATGLGAGAAGAKRNTTTIEGVRYRSRVNTSNEDRRSFSITVSPAVNPEAAKAAGRYQATVYCLRNYGGSDTDWAVGPSDPAQISDNALLLSGRCSQR